MSSRRKLVVTGHLGFIGSTFCEMFKNRYNIIGIDFAGWGSMPQNLVPGVHGIRADLANHRKMKTLLEKIEPHAIVNFAAESHVDRANNDDSGFCRSNVLGVRNLAIEASRLGCRLVQVSTDEVYGDATSNSDPWTERSPIYPKNAYAVTKAAAEMLLRVYSDSKTRRLDVVVTRGANTVGPRQFPEKAIPKAISCFTEGEPFPLYRTPARRMWMYVEDHAAGVEAALRRGKRGEVYNLAPAVESEAMTEDIIRRIRTLVGTGEIKMVKDRDSYDLRYWMDASKALQHLQWKAQYGLDQTLELTVGWYLKNRSWLKAANARLSRTIRSGA